MAGRSNSTGSWSSRCATAAGRRRRARQRHPQLVASPPLLGPRMLLSTPSSPELRRASELWMESSLQLGAALMGSHLPGPQG